MLGFHPISSNPISTSGGNATKLEAFVTCTSSTSANVTAVISLNSSVACKSTIITSEIYDPALFASVSCVCTIGQISHTL